MLSNKILPLIGPCLQEWLSGGYYTLDNITAAGAHLPQALMPHCPDFSDLGIHLRSIDRLSIRLR